MASIKISELNSLDKAEKEDILVIVDSSENETKKIAIEDLNIGSTDVVISDEQPEGEDWKLWIDSGEAEQLSEVIDSLDGDYTNLAPSVRAVKRELNNYSAEEVVIGEWFGKPLYRKVINFGTFPNATTKNVNHNISNLDFIIKIYGISFVSAWDGYVSLPFVTAGSDKQGDIQLSAYRTFVQVKTGSDRSGWGTNYIILEYTKTTDTAQASLLSEVEDNEV